MQVRQMQNLVGAAQITTHLDLNRNDLMTLLQALNFYAHHHRYTWETGKDAVENALAKTEFDASDSLLKYIIARITESIKKE